MPKPSSTFSQLLQSIMDEVKPIQAKAKEKMQQTVQEKLSTLDLVSRQEFDQQKATLTQCETKLSELEKQLKSSSKTEPRQKKDDDPS
ncbi:accessory factor UbiK family protein [Gammaproteobacteria bacterium]|nr:accessory factor UbiK family protein [Gammaproteobacteria bacterium]